MLIQEKSRRIFSKVTELNDYSGPFKPDLRFEDFSKEFLLKLIHSYEYAWLRMSGAWHTAVRKRLGNDAANECNLEAWLPHSALWLAFASA